MRHLLSFLAAGFTIAGAAELPTNVPGFVKSHCVDCHDSDAKKGGLDLTALTFDLHDAAVFNRWVQVLDRVEAGEMPPKSEERPPAAELREFTGGLSSTLREVDAARIAREGRVPARRLTRLQYERSLHDLLGIDVPLANLLPEDARADGFDTVAAAQQVSYHLLERYLAAIDVALDAAFARALQPEKPFALHLGWPELQQFRSRGREPGPRAAQQDAVAWSTGIAFHGRMPSTKVRESGWYRVTARVAAVNAPADGRVWCSVRSGVCFATAPTLFWIGSFAATAEEREHSFEAWIEAGHMVELRPLDSALTRTKFANFKTDIRTEEAERLGIPGVAIKSLKLERIHRGPEPAALRARLFGSLNPGATLKSTVGSADPRADTARLVGEFAARAFRAPVTAAAAAPYVSLALSELERSGDVKAAFRGAYRAVLASPRFLYFEEPAGALTDHAIAARLSYFLWSAPPDEELRLAAERGQLREPTLLRAQVGRMLQHPKAEAFITHFTDQWLNLSEIDFTTPDAKLYPEFDEVLKNAMLEETRLFFRELVRDDLGVANVVDSNFGLMNSRLARHYGVRWPGGEGVQRVSFRPEDRRGGLITHGSVLKVTANGSSTSPVIRGVWMLERVMGVPVPPVPANVPALEPDTRGAKTIREQLDKHRNTASCAACHVKIDPPGFALESYDVTGAWRDRYRISREGGKGGWQPGPKVDPSYELADGRRFSDLAEFKQLLLADRDRLARNLASKFVTYATGAGISFADRTAIDQIVATTRSGGHGVRSILHAVVESSLFLNK